MSREAHIQRLLRDVDPKGKTPEEAPKGAPVVGTKADTRTNKNAKSATTRADSKRLASHPNYKLKNINVAYLYEVFADVPGRAFWVPHMYISRPDSTFSSLFEYKEKPREYWNNLCRCMKDRRAFRARTVARPDAPIPVDVERDSHTESTLVANDSKEGTREKTTPTPKKRGAVAPSVGRVGNPPQADPGVNQVILELVDSIAKSVKDLRDEVHTLGERVKASVKPDPTEDPQKENWVRIEKYMQDISIRLGEMSARGQKPDQPTTIETIIKAESHIGATHTPVSTGQYAKQGSVRSLGAPDVAGLNIRTDDSRYIDAAGNYVNGSDDINRQWKAFMSQRSAPNNKETLIADYREFVLYLFGDDIPKVMRYNESKHPLGPLKKCFENLANWESAKAEAPFTEVPPPTTYAPSHTSVRRENPSVQAWKGTHGRGGRR